MRTLIPLYFLVGLLAVSAFKSELDEEWEEYKIKFKKIYESPFDEEERRLIWEHNLEFITKHNEEAEDGLHSFTLGINPFTDMSEAEFADTHTGLFYDDDEEDDPDFSSYETFDSLENQNLPSFIDWRTLKVVTPVKNQLKCGSCWAFGAVAALESHYALKTGKQVILSEQNLLDCVSPQYGCNGGDPGFALKYVQQNGGIATQKSYPYEAKKRECRYNKRQRGATISSYRRIDPRGGELALQRAVATVGPIIALLHANYTPEIKNYREGIVDTRSCMNRKPDHAVLLVGYGTMDGKDYWLIKNSWGSHWGRQGYFYLARNKNMCGVAGKGLYPVI